MRITLNLEDDLVEAARLATGIEGRTELIHEGLRALVQRESASRLAALGGSQPDVTSARRRRPE